MSIQGHYKINMLEKKLSSIPRYSLKRKGVQYDTK